MRVRYWSNCGFAEAVLGERGVLRPSRGSAAWVRDTAVPPFVALSFGSLSGGAASRARSVDSVADVAKTLLELSQKSDECIRRMMDVRASSRELEEPLTESA